MNDNKRNIDEFFLEELGNATETPPSSVWDTLEKRLDDNKSPQPIFGWWFYLLIALLFVGGSIAAYYIHNRTSASISHPITQPPIASPNTNAPTKHPQTDTTNDLVKTIKKNNNTQYANSRGNDHLQHKKKQHNSLGSPSNTAIANNIADTTSIQATSKTITTNASILPHKDKQNHTKPAKQAADNNNATRNAPANTSNNKTVATSTNILPRKDKQNQTKPTKQAEDNNDAARNAPANASNNKTVATNTNILPHKDKQNQTKPTTKQAADDNDAAKRVVPHTATHTAALTKSVKKISTATDTIASNLKMTNAQSTATRMSLHKKGTATQPKPVAKKNSVSVSKSTVNKALNATATDKPKNRNPLTTKHPDKDQDHIQSHSSSVVPASKKNIVNNTDVAAKKANSKPSVQLTETEENKPVQNHKPSTKIKITEQSNNSDSTKLSSVYQFNPASLKKEQEKKETKAKNKIADQLKDKNFLSGVPKLSEEDNNTSDILKEPNSTAIGGGAGTPDTKGKKIRKPLNMLIGVKAGYERGTNNFTASKYVGTIFGEVKFTNRLSFLLQPSIKIAQTNKAYTNTTGTYYQLGPDSTYATLYHATKDSITGTPVYDYAYKQSYDSMIASIQAQRRFIELELPFLFKYKLDNHFSVMLGINFTFGKLIALDNNLRTISGLTITDTLLNYKDSVAPAPSSKFSHSGSTPFSSYTATSSTTPSPIRFGYSLGLSYSFREKFLIDLLIQQNLSGYNNISDPELRKIFSQAYIRLSLGYTIFGTHKK
jgi:hypothetical protein